MSQSLLQQHATSLAPFLTKAAQDPLKVTCATLQLPIALPAVTVHLKEICAPPHMNDESSVFFDSKMPKKFRIYWLVADDNKSRSGCRANGPFAGVKLTFPSNEA
jgi:hypothetical protein